MLPPRQDTATLGHLQLIIIISSPTGVEGWECFPHPEVDRECVAAPFRDSKDSQVLWRLRTILVDVFCGISSIIVILIILRRLSLH